MSSSTTEPHESVKPHRDPKKINILSLDGGGIRGLYELWVLEEITKQIIKWGGSPDWITEYFDIICGTSTGGIIALGLGVQGLKIDDIQKLYENLGKKVFAKRLEEKPNTYFAQLIAYTQKLAGYVNFTRKTDSGCYNTEELVNLLKENFPNPFPKPPKKNATHDENANDKPANRPKVFVVATKDNSTMLEPFLIRSYQHYVPDEATRNTRIDWVDGTQETYGGTQNPSEWQPWEAARATSAAPYYFARYKHGETPFLDGGLVANNPTELALYEAFMTMGLEEGRAPGLVLSLGTGTTPNAYSNDTKSLLEWGGSLMNLVTESELTHKSVHRWRQSMKFFTPTVSPFTYVRIDPPNGAQFPLDAVDEMANMRDLIKRNLFSHETLWPGLLEKIGKELHSQGLLPKFPQ